jgi:hypothetical protein
MQHAPQGGIGQMPVVRFQARHQASQPLAGLVRRGVETAQAGHGHGKILLR